MNRPAEPSDVIWNWRTAPAAADVRAREVRSAHRRGLLGSVVGLAAAGVLWLAFDRPQASLVVASIALALAAIAFVWPRSLHRTITRGLERFARAVAMAVTWVLMTVLFFLVFLPLGLALRAAGKLAITRRPDRRLASYWVPVPDHKPSLDSYRRQF